jgi:hypothetical protein
LAVPEHPRSQSHPRLQLDAGLALPKSRTLKRTFLHRILSLRTLRFLFIARAGGKIKGCVNGEKAV